MKLVIITIQQLLFTAVIWLLLSPTTVTAQSSTECNKQLSDLIDTLDVISIAEQATALEMAHELIHRAAVCRNDSMYALAHLYIADIFFNQAYLTDAYDHYDSAYVQYKSLQDSTGMMESLMGLGNVYTELGEVEKAMNTYLILLDYFDSKRDTANIALCHYNISLIFLDQNNMLAAKIKLQETLRLMLQFKGDSQRLGADAMQMLGHILYQEGNADSARLLMNQSLTMVDTIQNPEFVHYAYINFALIDLEKKNLNSAWQHANRAVSIARKINDQAAMSSYYTILSGIMVARMENDKAVAYADTALYYANATESLNLLIKAHGSLATAFEKSGDFAKAYRHLDTTIKLEDSIRAYDAETRLMAYEQAVRDEETVRLKRENEYTESIRLAQQKIIRERSIAAIIIALLSIVLLVAFIYLYRLHQKGKQLNKAKDTILSVISHDLRGPIVQLNSLTNMQYQPLSDEVQKELKKNLSLASSHLANAFDNILYWSKSQMQGLQANIQRVELAPNLQEAVNFHSVYASSKNISINLTAEADLCHRCDPIHLQIIIRNLLGNAIKYSHKDNVINVSAGHKDNHLVVSVQDFGTGMSAEKVHKLLRKQVDFSTIGTRNELGTGLGFQLVKQFAQANQFTLSIDSTVGVGTSIQLTAPICNKSATA